MYDEFMHDYDLCKRSYVVNLSKLELFINDQIWDSTRIVKIKAVVHSTYKS